MRWRVPSRWVLLRIPATSRVPHPRVTDGSRAGKPGVRVRSLCKQYEIETLREYRHRSRREINKAREEGRRI